MKLRPQQFEQHIANELKPVYFISGDETLLVNEYCDLIRNKAKAAGFDERVRLIADNHFDWQSFYGESQNLSLFSEKRLLDLDLPTGKPGDQGSKMLTEFCQHIPDDTCLLIRAPKLASTSFNTRWAKSIDKAGVIMQVWPLDKQLPRWLANRMRSQGLTTSNDAINWLAGQVENNTLAASQEVDKLLLLYGPGEITLEQIQTAVSDNSRYDSFKLLDTALQKNAQDIVKILYSLRYSGEHPSLILWALTRELRTLEQMAFALAQGDTFQNQCQKHRIWSARQSLFQKALFQRSALFFQQLLIRCRRVDAIIKGVEPGHCWDGLLDVLLKMAR